MIEGHFVHFLVILIIFVFHVRLVLEGLRRDLAIVYCFKKDNDRTSFISGSVNPN